MKKLLLIAFLFSATHFAYSQKIYEYCELGVVPNSKNTEVDVYIDYGQTRKVKNEATVSKVFNSGIDALNFMALKGWELVMVYTKPVAQHDVFYYVIKREKQSKLE